MELISALMKVNEQEAANQRGLKAIFSDCGWPEGLSPKAYESVYLILQPGRAATMCDRLQMNAGKPQRFGTQTFAGKQNLLAAGLTAPKGVKKDRIHHSIMLLRRNIRVSSLDL